jgi:hypothetical protein
VHFFYLDESGCTGEDLKNKEQPIFVLGGISVRDKGWNETQEQVTRTFQDFFCGSIPQGFELHAKDLLSLDGHGFFKEYTTSERHGLAKKILNLLKARHHDVHYYAIDKAKLDTEFCSVNVSYSLKTPYLVAYDYLITYINEFLKGKRGQTARGMFIIDKKEQFQDDIERITRQRRFSDSPTHRIKWLVEFSYPIDSHKNPMIQLSDLVVFCTCKFLEIEGGYRGDYSPQVSHFYAECYDLIHNRIVQKTLVQREGRNMGELNIFLDAIQAKPTPRWRKKYGLH